jgi:hypothetical protein
MDKTRVRENPSKSNHIKLKENSIRAKFQQTEIQTKFHPEFQPGIPSGIPSL